MNGARAKSSGISQNTGTQALRGGAREAKEVRHTGRGGALASAKSPERERMRGAS